MRLSFLHFHDAVSERAEKVHLSTVLPPCHRFLISKSKLLILEGTLTHSKLQNGVNVQRSKFTSNHSFPSRSFYPWFSARSVRCNSQTLTNVRPLNAPDKVALDATETINHLLLTNTPLVPNYLHTASFNGGSISTAGLPTICIR